MPDDGDYTRELRIIHTLLALLEEKAHVASMEFQHNAEFRDMKESAEKWRWNMEQEFDL